MSQEIRDPVPSYLKGKIVAVFGFENEGFQQARKLRSDGVQVIVSLRQGSTSERWEKEGFTIVSIFDAADIADVFQVW